MLSFKKKNRNKLVFRKGFNLFNLSLKNLAAILLILIKKG